MAKATFHVRGIVVSGPDGDVVLNAGQNITIFPQGNLITIAAEIPSNLVLNGTTAYRPPSFLDADAPKGSIYFSLTSNKLAFKDSSSVSHNLY